MALGLIFILILYTLNFDLIFTLILNARVFGLLSILILVFWANCHPNTVHYGFWFHAFHPNTIHYGSWANFHPDTRVLA